ncbi:MAG TPA: histidine kinase [Flavobacteriaceae bacterium]|nr:histidine kinase [Flavobacteriaceae bacterium]
MLFRLIILVLFFVLPATAQVQDSISKKEGSSKKISSRAKDVELSLQKGNSKEIAENYVLLAKELMANNEYARAEMYLENALTLYKKEKNNSKIAEVSRLLAQAQEAQQKFSDAEQNYNLAGNASKGKESIVNKNDALRVQNQANPSKQLEYIDSNIQVLQEEGNVEEQVQAYQNRAHSNLKLDDKAGALGDYAKAIEIAGSQSEETIKLKSEVAGIYESQDMIEEAIEVRESAIEEAKAIRNISEEISQKKQLATLYDKKQNEDKAIILLEDAFQTALDNHRAVEAKDALLLLHDFYEKNNLLNKKDSVNRVFIEAFETLIFSDSTLIDAKYFATTEERIRQLEEQQQLKDQLLLKTNRLNYVLIGSVLVLALLMGWIIKSLMDIKKKNKKIALQSLRREMNPHFIFNSLNSVNQFIAQNKELEANKYLTSYSQLMRKMMESSNDDFIPLSFELEQIKKYLELEHMRFPDKFDFTVSVDETIDTDRVQIPNMLIQPNLENAIWHGLRYKDKKGHLNVSISRKGKDIEIIIQDDGIGLRKSQEIKTKNQKIHQSRGLKNVEERIQLLNHLYHKNIRFEISENQIGTRVTLVVSDEL